MRHRSRSIQLQTRILAVRRPRREVNRERIHWIERVEVLALPLALHRVERAAQHLFCLIRFGSHTQGRRPRI